WVPEVPRHQLAFQARYLSAWSLSLQGRWVGTAYDDDLNQLPLAPGWQVDARVGRRLPGGLEAFVAGENLFDAELMVARTPVAMLAPPRVLRAGLRLRAF
ncbi:MAG TPA: TonB-dependent receptor, partial [Vicinamibacteria bacterium]|nr:TonB-dependent receptor [Vicinamibacteria bacterium]